MTSKSSTNAGRITDIDMSDFTDPFKQRLPDNVQRLHVQGVGVTSDSYSGWFQYRNEAWTLTLS